MAKINLRDYLSGVEELIDNGQIDEALAHCRHILKNLPKNVDTYRLMGKAYLEDKRHGDAGDIFQRVLSSMPDDFIAHIGMSIIREDEGNLDTAIWHMERAFESQPSNRAIQDELQRLFGQREGYTPPKVRLTRGALARMYAHGDLYNQAISELLSALKEDARRPDLQVLLAEMHFKTQQENEAIEVCTQLLEKLPYCLFANRLMAHILGQNERGQEAQAYLMRVEELDPYAAQVGGLDPADSAPAESITLEHLVLQTGALRADDMPKSWTGALEPIFEKESDYEKEELPDWLALPNDEADEMVEEQDQELAEEGASQLESLQELEPDLAESSAMDLQEEAPHIEDSEALPEEQVPEWLRELRPGTDPPRSESTPTNLLDEDISGPADRESHSGEAVFEDEGESHVASFATEPGPIAQEPAGESGENDGLAWLEGLASKQGASEDELLTSPQERSAESPGWLEESVEDRGEKEPLAWLDEMAAEVEEHDQDLQQSQEEMEGNFSDTKPHPALQTEGEIDRSDTPDWLKDLAEEAEQATQPSGEMGLGNLEEPPDWLDELRPDAVADEEEHAEAEEAEMDAALSEPEAESAAFERLEQLGEAEPDEALDQVSDDLLDEDAEHAFEEDEIAPAAEPLASRQDEQNAWVPETSLEQSETAPSETGQAPESVVDAAPQSSKEAQLSEHLEQARQALNFDKPDDAADHYSHLVRKGALLAAVIADLQAATTRHPKNIGLWQALGDAYMRTDRLRDALDSYTKAEELL